MLKNKRTLIVVAIIAVVIFATYLFSGNGDYQTYTVERGQFNQIAEVNGKIAPAQDLNLAFEVVGKIDQINVETGDIVNEGDILVTLDSSEVSSELSEVLANLDKERSRLSEISGDSTSQNELQNSAENLLAVIRKSYTTADGIVRNNVDTFFDNPDGRIPDFSNSLGDYFLRQDISDKRESVGNLLQDWENKINLLDSAIVDNQDANNSITNLKEIEKLLALISSGTDEFSPTNSITQSQIDTYISNINNSRNTISDLIVQLNNAYNDFRDVQAELPVIQASVNNARASVDKLSARQSKYVLRAPFDGIITEQELERGQVISANEVVLSMISEDAFEVEAFVPELNIIGLDIGDKAKLKLDAFGPDIIFDAEVSHIDPRETIKDGVTTYRILLSLFGSNDDIRSGMTVDIELEKDSRENQIVIPRYLVSSDEEGDYVEILIDGKKERRNVLLGDVDGNGGVIIESGLSAGDKIIIK